VDYQLDWMHLQVYRLAVDFQLEYQSLLLLSLISWEV
jgi:hypothetical protein